MVLIELNIDLNELKSPPFYLSPVKGERNVCETSDNA